MRETAFLARRDGALACGEREGRDAESRERERLSSAYVYVCVCPLSKKSARARASGILMILMMMILIFGEKSRGGAEGEIRIRKKRNPSRDV